MPDLTQITSPSGARFTVAKEAADAFSGFLSDLEKSGYKIDQKTSGGYNSRNIAGTDTPSQHSFGRAIDINPAANARGAKTPSDLPANVNDIAAAHGLTWGGTWSGDTRDPMHFELSGNMATKKAASDDDVLKLLPAAPQPTAPTAAAPSDDDVLKLLPPAPVAETPSVTGSPTTGFLGEGSPAMQAWRSYQAAGSLHNWLAPAPDTEYSSTPLVPFAKDTKTGETRLALPGPLRNFLYSATGDLSEGMTADPTTGRFGTTPEMGSAINMLAGAGARPTGFSRPLSAVPLAEREAAAAGKPPPEAPYEFRDIKPVAPGPSDRPTGPSERVPPDLPTEAVRSSATAKIAEDARYGDVTRSSDITSMDAVNRAVDNAIPQDEAAAARREFGKDSVVTKQIDNLQGIKDRELTVQRWKGYDQSFSDDIQTLIKQGNSAAARQLQIIQQRMRNQIENPFGDDLTSGDGNGFASLKVARQTSAQRQKMEDVERMMALAKGRKVPQTSVQSQITNFKNNEAKSRGWSDDEMAALTKAAETGEFGDLMHTLGSKLAPAIGLGPAIAESLFTHEAPSALGMAAGVPVATATYYLGKGARGIENMLLRRRMQNALDVLGQSVPTNPLNMPP